MYASLYALRKLRIMDYKVDYLNFGCLFVKSASVQCFEAVSQNQAYPEPVWISAEAWDPLLANIIKAGNEQSRHEIFFSVDQIMVYHAD